MLCSARDNEPGNNLGKTICELRQVFPNARYLRTEVNGDFYTDGEDPSEGLSCFFYLKNNRVIEECMIIQSNDGFPKMVYDAWINTFSKYMRVAAKKYEKIYYFVCVIDYDISRVIAKSIGNAKIFPKQQGLFRPDRRVL